MPKVGVELLIKDRWSNETLDEPHIQRKTLLDWDGKQTSIYNNLAKKHWGMIHSWWTDFNITLTNGFSTYTFGLKHLERNTQSRLSTEKLGFVLLDPSRPNKNFNIDHFLDFELKIGNEKFRPLDSVRDSSIELIEQNLSTHSTSDIQGVQMNFMSLNPIISSPFTYVWTQLNIVMSADCDKLIVDGNFHMTKDLARTQHSPKNYFTSLINLKVNTTNVKAKDTSLFVHENPNPGQPFIPNSSSLAPSSIDWLYFPSHHILGDEDTSSGIIFPSSQQTQARHIWRDAETIYCQFEQKENQFTCCIYDFSSFDDNGGLIDWFPSHADQDYLDLSTWSNNKAPFSQLLYPLLTKLDKSRKDSICGNVQGRLFSDVHLKKSFYPEFSLPQSDPQGLEFPWMNPLVTSDLKLAMFCFQFSVLEGVMLSKRLGFETSIIMGLYPWETDPYTYHVGDEEHRYSKGLKIKRPPYSLIMQYMTAKCFYENPDVYLIGQVGWDAIPSPIREVIYGRVLNEQIPLIIWSPDDVKDKEDRTNKRQKFYINDQGFKVEKNENLNATIFKNFQISYRSAISGLNPIGQNSEAEKIHFHDIIPNDTSIKKGLLVQLSWPYKVFGEGYNVMVPESHGFLQNNKDADDRAIALMAYIIKKSVEHLKNNQLLSITSHSVNSNTNQITLNINTKTPTGLYSKILVKDIFGETLYQQGSTLLNTLSINNSDDYKITLPSIDYPSQWSQYVVRSNAIDSTKKIRLEANVNIGIYDNLGKCLDVCSVILNRADLLTKTRNLSAFSKPVISNLTISNNPTNPIIPIHYYHDESIIQFDLEVSTSKNAYPSNNAILELGIYDIKDRLLFTSYYPNIIWGSNIYSCEIKYPVVSGHYAKVSLFEEINGQRRMLSKAKLWFALKPNIPETYTDDFMVVGWAAGPGNVISIARDIDRSVEEGTDIFHIKGGGIPLAKNQPKVTANYGQYLFEKDAKIIYYSPLMTEKYPKDTHHSLKQLDQLRDKLIGINDYEKGIIHEYEAFNMIIYDQGEEFEKQMIPKNLNNLKSLLIPYDNKTLNSNEYDYFIKKQLPFRYGVDNDYNNWEDNVQRILSNHSSSTLIKDQLDVLADTWGEHFRHPPYNGGEIISEWDDYINAFIYFLDSKKGYNQQNISQLNIDWNTNFTHIREAASVLFFSSRKATFDDLNLGLFHQQVWNYQSIHNINYPDDLVGEMSLRVKRSNSIILSIQPLLDYMEFHNDYFSAILGSFDGIIATASQQRIRSGWHALHNHYLRINGKINQGTLVYGSGGNNYKGLDFKDFCEKTDYYLPYAQTRLYCDFVRSFGKKDALRGIFGNNFHNSKEQNIAFVWHNLFRGNNAVAWYSSSGNLWSAFLPDTTLNERGKGFYQSANRIKEGIGKLLLDHGTHALHTKQYNQRIGIVYAPINAVVGEITSGVNPGLESLIGGSEGYWKEYESFCMGLRTLGYQFDHVHVDDIENASRINDFDMLIYNYPMLMSNDLHLSLKLFVNNGGTLIVNGLVALYDENGKPRSVGDRNIILGDLFGTKISKPFTDLKVEHTDTMMTSYGQKVGDLVEYDLEEYGADNWEYASYNLPPSDTLFTDQSIHIPEFQENSFGEVNPMDSTNIDGEVSQAKILFTKGFPSGGQALMLNISLQSIRDVWMDCKKAEKHAISYSSTFDTTGSEYETSLFILKNEILSKNGFEPFAELIHSFSNPPRNQVTEIMPAIEQVVFRNNNAYYLGLQKDFMTRDYTEDSYQIEINGGNQYYVYQMRESAQGMFEQNTKTDIWDVDISLGKPALFALLPYKIQRIDASATISSSPDNITQLNIKGLLYEENGIEYPVTETHVLHMKVYRDVAMQNAFTELTRNIVILPETETNIPFALAKNDFAWQKIVLTDAATGIQKIIGFDVFNPDQEYIPMDDEYIEISHQDIIDIGEFNEDMDSEFEL